ncbi:MAG: hypothetical protein R3F13_11055 [Prosthecobacter sp.]
MLTKLPKRLLLLRRRHAGDDMTNQTTQRRRFRARKSELFHHRAGDRREGVAVVKQNGAMRWQRRQTSTASINVIGC